MTVLFSGKQELTNEF